MITRHFSFLYAQYKNYIIFMMQISWSRGQATFNEVEIQSEKLKTRFDRTLISLLKNEYYHQILVTDLQRII
jgi:hypothetical protein